MKKAKGEPGCADPQMGQKIQAPLPSYFIHLVLSTQFSFLWHFIICSFFLHFHLAFLTLAGSTYKCTPSATPPIGWVIMTIA